MSDRHELRTVRNAKSRLDALASALPRIETDRLVLRGPRLGDWPFLEPIWTSERSRFIGGPMSPGDAWLDFSQCVASWILRGFGWLTVAAISDDEVLGLVGISHEYGDPEPELGWLLTEAAEGNGYALEAARALLPLAQEIFGAGNFVSYIDRRNVRSIRLAEKLGATPDGTSHPLDGNVMVYRHGDVH